MAEVMRPYQTGQDDLGNVLRAVGMAMDFYKVKLDNDRQNVIAKRRDDLEKQKQDNDKAKADETARKDRVTFQDKYAPGFGQPKPDEATIALGDVPKGVQIPEGATHYKATKKDNPYQDLMAEMAQTRLELARQTREDQRDKVKNEAVRKISERVEKSGVTDLLTSLKKLDAAIPGGIEGSDADGDIPGVGDIGNVEGTSILGVPVGKAVRPMLSEEGKKVRGLIASVRNAILKAKAGTAVSAAEADRILEELGTGVNMSDTDLRRGLQNLKDVIRDNIGIIEAGTDPDVLTEFRMRPGAITTQDPFFDSHRQKISSNKQTTPQGKSGTAYGAPAESKEFDPDAFLKGP